MPKAKPSAMDFIVAQLKKNPKVEYAAVKERAEKKKLVVFPVMYGRAKLMLGMVKVGKKKKAAKRGPGRPRKKVIRRGRPKKDVSALGAVQDALATFRDQGRENEQLRATLEKIRDLIDRVA